MQGTACSGGPMEEPRNITEQHTAWPVPLDQNRGAAPGLSVGFV